MDKTFDTPATDKVFNEYDSILSQVVVNVNQYRRLDLNLMKAKEEQEKLLGSLRKLVTAVEEIDECLRYSTYQSMLKAEDIAHDVLKEIKG